MIADILGIVHPRNPKTKELIPIDFDFFIEVIEDNGESRWIARTFKEKDKLCNKRVIEKFEIAGRWCSQKGIDWGIITEEELDNTVCKNIEKVCSYKELESVGLKTMRVNGRRKLIECFISNILECRASLRDICLEIEEEFELNYGIGLALFKYLVANHVIEIDLKKELDVSHPVVISFNKAVWKEHLKK